VTKKAQATRVVEDAPKKPLGEKIGSGTTKATAGSLYAVGRGVFRFGKNFGRGASSAWSEIKRGYDEAASEEK